MEKRDVEIERYLIAQLNKNIYEARNPAQNLDFYIDAENPDEVQVIVFDSLIPANHDKAYLGVFFAASLKEAVSDMMLLTKDNLKESVMWL
ncbi:MAG: hypothetical protein M3384_10110 [Acidobacteriota bacterium]|nr:hypothetical protein [Acidobacteriota bacterium]